MKRKCEKFTSKVEEMTSFLHNCFILHNNFYTDNIKEHGCFNWAHKATAASKDV